MTENQADVINILSLEGKVVCKEMINCYTNVYKIIFRHNPKGYIYARHMMERHQKQQLFENNLWRKSTTKYSQITKNQHCHE